MSLCRGIFDSIMDIICEFDPFRWGWWCWYFVDTCQRGHASRHSWAGAGRLGGVHVGRMIPGLDSLLVLAAAQTAFCVHVLHLLTLLGSTLKLHLLLMVGSTQIWCVATGQAVATSQWHSCKSKAPGCSRVNEAHLCVHFSCLFIWFFYRPLSPLLLLNVHSSINYNVYGEHL